MSPPDLITMFFEKGCRPRYTVLGLDGSLDRLRRPELALSRNVPFTKVPLGADSQPATWQPIAAGRWKHADHIILGERRGSLVGLNLVALAGWCRKRVLSLMDNLAWCGASAKGRSPAFPLNNLFNSEGTSLK